MSKSIAVSSGDRLIAIGDSIAKGLSLTKNKGLLAHANYSKVDGNAKYIAETLIPEAIKKEGGSLSKHHVVLSTGWTNSTWMTKEEFEGFVAGQLNLLKEAGAKTVIVLGVANNFSVQSPAVTEKAQKIFGKEYNKELQNIVTSRGFLFGNGFTAIKQGTRSYTQPPKSYYDASPAMQALASAFVGVRGEDLSTGGQDSNKKKVEAEGGDLKEAGDMSLREKLEYVSNLPTLIKQRADFSRKRDGDAKVESVSSKDADNYQFNYNVENMIKGISNVIDIARDSGYPSLSWLKSSDTVEDTTLISQLNHNWINSFTGYSYPDLRFEEAFGETPEDLRKKRPTFFIKSKPLITEELIKQHIDVADSRATEAIKDLAKKGIMDELAQSVLDTSVETNALNETDDYSTIGQSNIAAVLESETQALKERRYIPVEGVTEGEVKPTESTAEGLEGGSTGTNSTYTGEFSSKIQNSIGSLQDSRKDNVAPGYPATLRAFLDFVSRMEGTHATKYKSDSDLYGHGYNTMFGGKKGSVESWTAPRDNGSGSSATGRYQFMAGTWKSGTKMTAANQDKAALDLVKEKGKGVYEALLEGNYHKAFSTMQSSTKSCIGAIWASIPINDYRHNGKPQVKAGWTVAMCVEACEALKKFYSNTTASTDPNQTKVRTPSSGAELIDKTLNPKTLDTSGGKIFITVSEVVQEDLFKHFKHFKHLPPLDGLKFIDAINADTYIVSKDSKVFLIKPEGVVAPSVRTEVTFTTEGILYGTNQTKVNYGKNEVFGKEAREAVVHLLRGKTLHIQPSKAQDTKVPGFVGKISYGNVKDLGLALIGLGVARPTVNSSKLYQQGGDDAEKRKVGVWGYKTSAITATGYAHLDSPRTATHVQHSHEQNLANDNTAEYANNAHLLGDRKKMERKPDVIVRDDVMKEAVRNSKQPAVANTLSPDSKPAKLAKKANAGTDRTKTKGECAKYVRIALAAAGYSIPDRPTHADDYHLAGALKRWGFEQISLGEPIQLGDILVTLGGWGSRTNERGTQGGDHYPGHIHIYTGNGMWVSDFKTKKPNVYRKLASHVKAHALYRDKNYLNGAKPIEKQWQPLSAMTGGAAVTATVSGTLDDASYTEAANAMGVYPDLSAYTPDQIRGHGYIDVDYEQEVTDSERMTVYSRELRKEKYAKMMAHNYSKGLDVCFPVVKAYVVIGNEDDEIFVAGMPLNPAVYYELPPIQSYHLETNNDFNPLDVCTFSVINPSAIRSLADQHSDIGLAYDPNEVNTQYFNPVLLEKLRILPGMKIHVRAGYSNDPNKLIPVFNGVVKETSGALERVIECVCESYANELLSQQLGYNEPVDFSGDHNASTGLLIAYALMSDNVNHFGTQLGRLRVAQAWIGGATSIVKSAYDVVVGETLDDIKDAKNSFANGNIGQGLLATADALATPASFLLPVGWLARGATVGLGLLRDKIQETEVSNDESMTYFANEKSPFAGLLLGGKGRAGDFRDPENKALVAPFSGGQFLWNVFNPSRANLSMRLFQNIFSDNIEQIHDTYRDTAFGRWFKGVLDWDVKVLYRFYVYRSTAWTVLKEMEYRHPGTLAKPLLYEERMTMFYGIKEQLYIARDLDPMYMLRAAYQNRHHNASKPYSKSYLKMRELRLEPATGYHFLSTQTNVISNDLKLNRDFATKATAVYFESKYWGLSEKTKKKSETILLSDSLSKFDIKESVVELGGCHGSYMAWLYATQELKRQLETMYGGSIVVVGDPTIKAGDYAYIYDADKSIKGTIKVREASHHFSPTDGYITIITPGLHTEASHFFWDDYILKLHLASSLLNSITVQKQDANLTNSEYFDRYQYVLAQMAGNSTPSTGGVLYSFGLWALLAGVSLTLMSSTLRHTYRSLKGNGAKLSSIAKVYSKALKQEGWQQFKTFRQWSGTKVQEANKRIQNKMTRRLLQQEGGKEAVRALKEMNVKAKGSRIVKLLSKGPAIIKKAWSATRWLRTLAMGAAGLALMTPVGAITAAVVTVILEIALAWVASKVRRAYLTHNSVSFFPLDHAGSPFVAGITGFSDRGALESAIYNLKRNAKILSKAGKAMEQSGTYPNGETDWIQSNIGETLQFLFDRDYIKNMTSKIEEDMRGGPASNDNN